MNALSQQRKRTVRWIISAILAIDVFLLGYNVLRQTPGPGAQRQEELLMQAQVVRLRQDVEQAQHVRDHLGDVQRECDEFFSSELRPASSGYSSIVADLNGIAKEAGLRTSGLTFTQHDIGNRGIEEIEIAGTVEGAYPNLVTFINGLERSHSFYVLESLELASSTGSELRMNLRLKTYFRMQA